MKVRRPVILKHAILSSADGEIASLYRFYTR